MNVTQLAASTKLTVSTIQSIEEGKTVSIQITYRVAGFLLKKYRTMCYIDETTLANALKVVPSVVTEMENGTFNNPHLFRNSINALDKMIGYDEQKNKHIQSEHNNKSKSANPVKPHHTKKKVKERDVEWCAVGFDKPGRKKEKYKAKKKKEKTIGQLWQVYYENERKGSELSRKKKNKEWEESRKKAQAIMNGMIKLPEPPTIYPVPSFMKEGKEYYQEMKKEKSNTNTGMFVSRSKLNLSDGVHGDYETL